MNEDRFITWLNDRIRDTNYVNNLYPFNRDLVRDNLTTIRTLEHVKVVYEQLKKEDAFKSHENYSSDLRSYRKLCKKSV